MYNSLARIEWPHRETKFRLPDINIGQAELQLSNKYLIYLVVPLQAYLLTRFASKIILKDHQ